MALLNWGKKYSEIASAYVGISKGDTNGNYEKLLFTNVEKNDEGVVVDYGHIITHGIDYTPTYNGIARGFVPEYVLTDYNESWTTSYTKGKANSVLFGDGVWRYIRTVDLPMIDYSQLESENYTDDNIFSAASTVELVNDKIANAFKSNDAMQFKGGIKLNASGDWEFTESEITTLDSGFTFRASEAFTMPDGTTEVEAGDVLVYSGPDGAGITSADAENSANWVIVEGNVKGTSTYTVNGTDYKVASEDNQNFTIYAPTTAGSKGALLYSTEGTPDWTDVGNPNQVLVGNSEGAPTWLNKTALEAGYLYKTKDNGATIDDTGNYNAYTLFSDFSHLTDGTYNTGYTITVGDKTIPLEFDLDKVYQLKALDAVSADRTDHSLKVAESKGLTLSVTEFNGSEDAVLSLNIAQSATEGATVAPLLGGVVIDGGIVETGIGGDGDTIKGKGGSGATLSVTNEGVVYLTETNIINALGYAPSDMSDFIIANEDANGLVPQLVRSEVDLQAGYYVLAFDPDHENWDITGEEQSTKVNPVWRQLPSNLYNLENIFKIYVLDATIEDNLAVSYDPLVESNPETLLTFKAPELNSLGKLNRVAITTTANSGVIEFESTWRPIQVNGTDITDGTLNIVSSSDILVATSSVEDADNGSVDEVGFCIAWHNIEDDSIEYVSPSVNNTTI